MSILDQIQFTGSKAAELRVSFEYLYNESPSFKFRIDEHFSSANYIPITVSSSSAIDVPGVQNVLPDGLVANAPGYNIPVDGKTYIGINFDVTATIVSPGIPSGWTYSLGQEVETDVFIHRLQDLGYIDASEFFPSGDDRFWINNGQYIPGYAEWSSLPDVDTFFNLQLVKWAYFESNLSATGLSFQDFAGDTDLVYEYISSQDAFVALAELKSASIITREMSLEERLGHEFAHSFISGGLINEEGDVIEYMSSVRADLGLPEFRIGTDGSISVQDLLSTLAKSGYSIPSTIQIIEALGGGCFCEGTEIQMWTGGVKRIEKISIGDLVTSYSVSGELTEGRVSNVFVHNVRTVLDVFGFMVTPGHSVLCGDGKFEGKHVPIIDILVSDGAMVTESGELIRANTGCAVGSAEDQFVHIHIGQKDEDGNLELLDRGMVRAGMRFILDDGKDVSISDMLRHANATVNSDGNVETLYGITRTPLHLPFLKALPRPEDYILKRSGLTLEDIYRAGEWEDGARPILEPPVKSDIHSMSNSKKIH